MHYGFHAVLFHISRIVFILGMFAGTCYVTLTFGLNQWVFLVGLVFSVLGGEWMVEGFFKNVLRAACSECRGTLRMQFKYRRRYQRRRILYTCDECGQEFKSDLGN